MLSDFVHFEFLRTALIAGVLIACLAGAFGVFVVQRGMSYLGNGLAHAAFGGIGLALLLGIQPLYIAVPATIATACGITWTCHRSTLRDDVVIGIFVSVCMALGIVLLSFRSSYTADAFNFLFGSILAITQRDVLATGVVALLAGASMMLWSRWAYETFDPELAQADRLAIRAHDYVLSAMIALTIVIAARIVGILLISAFLVIPPATARLICRSFASMTVLSMLIGIASTVVGLGIAYRFDLPAGATMVLVQGAMFVATALVIRPAIKS